MTKVTDLPALAAPVDGDKIHVVDVSDTTDDAAGTSKQSDVFDVRNGPGNVVYHGADKTGATDSQASFDLAIAAADVVVIPSGTYSMGDWEITSNKTIWCEPGVVLNGGSSYNRVINFRVISDSHFYGNGAVIDGDGLSASGSHNVAFLGATRCTMRDTNIQGQSQSGKDGIYLGVGVGNAENIDCHIIRGSVTGSGRNGISPIACRRCTFTDIVIHDINTAAPRAGIDIEANATDAYRNTKNRVSGCHVYNCGGGGVQTTHGDRTVVEYCEIHNCDRGINMSGQSWNVGVESFDAATGWITIGTDLIDVPVGICVSFYAVGAGNSIPSDMLTTVYIVQDHNGTDQIRVARAIDVSIATSWAGDEVGTGNKDVDLSDFAMNLFQIDNEGNNGNGEYSYIRNNWIHNNDGEGIYSAVCSRTIIENNEVWDNGASDDSPQIQLLYVYQSRVQNNTAEIRDLATAPDAAGILVSFSSYCDVSGNRAMNTGRPGIRVANSSYSSVERNTVYNCGALGVTDNNSLYLLEQCVGLAFDKNRGRASSVYQASLTYGLRVDAGCEHCTFTSNQFRDGGPDNAGSISYASTDDNHWHFNIKYDGTLYVP